MTTKKETASIEKTEVVEIPEVKAQETKTPVEKERPKKKAIDMDSLVEVYNGTHGILVVEDKKSGESWTFMGYGDTDFISVGQLRSVKNSHPRILNSPWLIINDKEVVDFFGLTPLYKDIVTQDNLMGIFDLSNEAFEQKLRKLPAGCKELVVGKALELADALDDRITMSKAKVIKEIFGVAVYEALMADK